MGCDYWEKYYLSIELKNNDVKDVLFEEDSIYADYSWDSDSDDDFDRQRNLYEEELHKKVVKKDKKIYDGNKWLITSKMNIAKYINIIEEKGLTINQIRSIKRYGQFVRR